MLKILPIDTDMWFTKKPEGAPQTVTYATVGDKHTVELGLGTAQVQPPNGQGFTQGSRLFREGRMEALLWLMVIALMLWLVTYTVAVTLSTAYDIGYKTKAFIRFRFTDNNESLIIDEGDS